MTTHVNMTSGGTGSWATGVRIVDTRVRPGDHFVSIFADTNMEDEDLYRFLDDCEKDLRVRVEELGATFEAVRLADGRDVWEVFFAVRFLGNTRIDPCSKILKRTLIRKWVNDNLAPDDAVIYLGIDWSEEHRFHKSRPFWEPYTVEAPLTERPFIDKDDIRKALAETGIIEPRLYAMGFPHNNCGGFCVKSGFASFRILLDQMPERYAYHERREQELREFLGKPVTILRDRSFKNIARRLGHNPDDLERRVEGEKRKNTYHVVRSTGERLPAMLPITLREFRERVEAEDFDVDPNDLGGCACFTPDDDYAADLAQST